MSAASNAAASGDEWIEGIHRQLALLAKRYSCARNLNLEQAEASGEQQQKRGD